MAGSPADFELSWEANPKLPPSTIEAVAWEDAVAAAEVGAGSVDSAVGPVPSTDGIGRAAGVVNVTLVSDTGVPGADSSDSAAEGTVGVGDPA